MTIPFIIGNAIALVSSILMVVAGLTKNKKKIIFTETIQIALAIVSDFILGGITGAIINLVSIARNILCYKEKLNNKLKILIIVVSSALTIAFNNLGLIGYLPLLSIITYTWWIDLKDVVKFKYLVLFSMIMWIIYDYTIKSYIFMTFDGLSIIANIVAIIQLKSKVNKKKEVKA